MASFSLFGIRARAADRLAKLVDFRVRGEVDSLERRLAEQQHEPRLNEQEHCTIDHRRRLDALESGLEHVRGDLRWTAGELERLIPHVAAQDARLETLRERLAVVPPVDQPELAEARSLVEEVQRQHAQIRVRLAGIARYEDRLRRLERQAENTEATENTEANGAENAEMSPAG